MGTSKSGHGGGQRPPWLPSWKGTSWWYDFYALGERYRQSTHICDPEAFEIAKKIAKRAYHDAWTRAESPYPTLAEAARLYVAETGAHSREIEAIIDYFGPFVYINEINNIEITKCVLALSRPGNKPQTGHRKVATPLLAVINYALGFRRQPREDNERTRTLTPEELERLIRIAMDPPNTIRDPESRLLKIIAFLVGTGARTGEMFCVRARDVNRATGGILIRGEETGAGKSGNSQRWVYPPKRSWELMGDLPSEGRVFLSTSGKPMVRDGKRGSTVIRQFRKLCDAAGLGVSEDQPEPLVFHSLRHTWAQFFSSQVGDQDLLIDRGGWAKADMARRYRKRVPLDLADRLLAHGWDSRA